MCIYCLQIKQTESKIESISLYSPSVQSPGFTLAQVNMMAAHSQLLPALVISEKAHQPSFYNYAKYEFEKFGS